MPFGLMLLVIISILIVFGVAHQVLDRMRLNDKAVLLIIGGMIVGTLLPNIPITNNFSINIGGAIIPIALCVYLFIKAGTVQEKNRAIASTIIAATVVFLAGRFLPSEPQTTIMDPNYVYGILAGVTAYLIGRSRRSAFIAGIMGVILADIAQGVINIIAGVAVPVRLGAAGIVDAVVISGLIAVILAEVVGEFREKLQGGTVHKEKYFQNAEFTSSLGTSGKRSASGDRKDGQPQHGSGQDGQPIGGMEDDRTHQGSGEGGQPEHGSGQDGQPIGGMGNDRSHQGSGEGGQLQHGSGQDGQPIGGMEDDRTHQGSGEGGQPQHGSGQDSQPIGGMEDDRTHQGSGEGVQLQHGSGQDGQPIGGMGDDRSHQGSGKKNSSDSDQNQVQEGDSENEKQE